MMRKIFGLLSIFVIFLSACAAQKKAGSTVETSSAPKVNYVQMWRTSCFGKCPDYKIDIYEEGLVRYTGQRFTDTGIYEKNIGKEQALKLLSRFTNAHVDTLKQSYDVLITDLPGINYTFKYGNTVKEVRNAQFGPFFLKEYANELDKLVKAKEEDVPRMDASWEKISDNTKGE